MSAYLARLKRIDANNLANTPYMEVSKVTKAPFGTYGTSLTGRIVKNNSDAQTIHLNNDYKKCAIGEPTEGHKEVISNWWLLHFIDADPIQAAIYPPCNYAEALAFYPTAIAAEPIPSPIDETVEAVNE